MIKYWVVTVFIVAICIGFNFIGLGRVGAVIDRDFQSIHRDERISKVSSSKSYKIAIIYDGSASLEVSEYQTIVDYVNIINNKGGVNGKNIEIVSSDKGQYIIDYLAEVQELCTPKDIVACIGPFKSSNIIPTRALTNFAAVPLISSSTVYSEMLPILENDNYVTSFPPLENLVNLTLSKMKEEKVDEVLIITPEQGTYGDLFSTQLERIGHNNGSFKEVFRISYQTPLQTEDIDGVIEMFLRYHRVDALFFAGDETDMEYFLNTVDANKIYLPIYSTEQINTTLIRNHRYPLKLWVPNFHMNEIEKGKLKSISIDGADNNFFLSYLNIKMIDDLAKLLAKDNYEPIQLTQELKKINYAFYSNSEIEKKLELINIGAE